MAPSTETNQYMHTLSDAELQPSKANTSVTVSQPFRVEHSHTRKGLAQLWMAPSTETDQYRYTLSDTELNAYQRKLVILLHKITYLPSFTNDRLHQDY